MNALLHILPALIASTPRRWLDLARAFPPDLLALPPAESEWSALGCLQHLIDSEMVFQFRVRAFLDGRDFPDFDPAADGTKPGMKSPLALAEEFAGLRAASLRLVQNLVPPDLERRARHAALGPVTLGEMLHNWAAHDLNHTVQAERALMQPFIQGCGPWQRYFTDHFIPPAGSA